MDFDFSDDDVQLQDAVRRWVGREYTFDARRAIVAQGGFSRETYGKMVSLGLSALLLPERLGGMAMGPISAMIVMEELGRGLVMEPLAHALVTSILLSRYASPEVQSRWCSAIASGEALVVLAMQERGSRYTLAPCRTEARQGGAGWQVSGVKSLVPAGNAADAFVVSAVTQQGLGMFLVPRDSSGVSARAYQTQDGSRAAEIALAAAGAECLALHGGLPAQGALDHLTALTCAEGIGVMDATLATTVEYLKTRRQFGVDISSFQVLRHRIADMKMALELARSMAYYATLKLDAPQDERTTAISRAKYQVGVSMRFIGQQAIQLHGGIGMTDEYVVSHQFRRLTQLEMTCGDSNHHLGIVASALKESVGVFT